MTRQIQQKWSVIQDILLLINKLWRQQHGRAIKKRLLVKLVDGTRWKGKRTSGSIPKHFLSCRWQLPYIWGHDHPRKWDQSRWLIK